MSNERPQVTAAFIALSIKAHAVRHKTYVFPKTVALLTCTSESFWEELRVSGKGPQHHRFHGHDWFVLAEVQEWLVANICSGSEVHND